MAIGKEIDRGRCKPSEPASFTFFRKISTDLCAAIARPDESADALLQHYLAQIEDDRLKRAFAGAIEMDQALTVRKPRQPRDDSALLRRPPARSSVRSTAPRGFALGTLC